MLSQAYLHHELTGELLEPCVGQIVDLLTNRCPESFSKAKSNKGVKNHGRPPLPSSQRDNNTDVALNVKLRDFR